MNTPHLIRQQYLHVEVNGTEADGWDIQRRLSEISQHELLLVLDKTLAHYAPQQGYAYIERLEVDAGSLRFDNWESELVAAITQALEKRLQEQPVFTAPSSGVGQYKSEAQAIQQAFLCFLDTGSLPWWFARPDSHSAFELAVLDARQQDPAAFDAAIQRMLALPTALNRLVQQFSPDFLEKLLVGFALTSVIAVQKILQILDAEKLAITELNCFSRQLWQTALTGRIQRKTYSIPALVVTSWHSLPSAQKPVWASRLSRYWPDINEAMRQLGAGFDSAQPAGSSIQAANYSAQPADSSVQLTGNSAQSEDHVTALTSSSLASKERIDLRENKNGPDRPVQQATQHLNATSSSRGERAGALQEPAESAAKPPRPMGEGWGEGDKNDVLSAGSRESFGAGNALESLPLQEALANRLDPSDSLNGDMVALAPDPLSSAERSLSGVEARAGFDSAQPADSFAQPAGGSVQAKADPAERTDLLRKQITNAAALLLKEGVYIDCAGLVLLHPFLPRLFQALGMVDEEQLLQPERALYLLHFLTTGQEFAPEYRLQLPKLLCGIALDAPVACVEGLTEAERAEALALLQAVIRHWEALRNTSVDGLRGTFLIRPGKISQREDGDYLLQVERRSFDILLDSLPWGISIIQLPWMETMLWVEWQ